MHPACPLFLGAGTLGAALAGCAPQATAPQGTGSAELAAGDPACLPIPEDAVFRVADGKLVPAEAGISLPVFGDADAYYQIVDGELVEVDLPPPVTIPASGLNGGTATKTTAADTPPEPEPEPEPETPWTERLVASFPELGYPWLELDDRNLAAGVVTLTGLAPDEETKLRGLIAGESAIRDVPEGADILVVDGIAISGGETAVGEALAELDTAATAEACQDAFNDTMQGRLVSFSTGGASINDESARLLDALTGVAILCARYSIEIQGHTDTTGSALANQALSESRASAVRQYLIDKGVEARTLRAIGYGEVRPLDRRDTPEAHARNRRVEFVVRER